MSLCKVKVPFYEVVLWRLAKLCLPSADLLYIGTWRPQAGVLWKVGLRLSNGLVCMGAEEDDVREHLRATSEPNSKKWIFVGWIPCRMKSSSSDWCNLNNFPL
jgi:hypothetical protein